MWAKCRLWIAATLAVAALVLAALAAAVPFIDDPPGGAAGAIAALVIAAEGCAALAILMVGKQLYGKIRAKLQSVRTDNAL